MSMSCSLYRLTPEQVDQLTQHPHAVGQLLGDEAPIAPTRPGLLARLFGAKPAEVPVQPVLFEPLGEGDRFELEQAWHVLHFLFTGTADAAEMPGGFLVEGGAEIGPDRGYGAPRLLSAAQTAAVATFLQRQDRQALDRAYATDAITAAEIYWQAAEDAEERRAQLDDLGELTERLAAFLRQSVTSGAGTLVSIY